jgi:hypothetical protein
MAKNSQRSKKILQGRRKYIKKKQETGSVNSITDRVDSGSGPDYQIYIPFGWALW